MAKITKVSFNGNEYNFGGVRLDSTYKAYDAQLWNGNLSAGTSQTISLSSFLTENCDYEIFIGGFGRANTSGKWCKLAVVSGTKSYANISDSDTIDIGETNVRTSAYYNFCSSAWIPIKSTDKNITIYNNGTTTTNGNINLLGYRKIGKKPTSNIINSISYNNTTYDIDSNFRDKYWYFDFKLLGDNFTINSGDYISYDLSDYLLDANSIYLVSVSGYVNSLTSSSYIKLDLYGGGSAVCPFMATDYHSTSTYYSGGSMVLPVYPSGGSPGIALYNNGTSKSGACGLWLLGYRQLGTNDW